MFQQRAFREVITPYSSLNKVKGLAKGFEDQIFDIQKKRHDSQPHQNRGSCTQALAAAIITGCTQIELEYGIHAATEGENFLRVFIPLFARGHSKKVVSKYRRLKIDATRNSATRFLYDYLKNFKTAQRIHLSADRLNDLLGSLTSEYKKTLGKRGSDVKITQTLLRHLLFSQMLECGYDTEEMTRILGLSSKYSLKNYATEIPHHPVIKGFIQFDGYLERRK